MDLATVMEHVTNESFHKRDTITKLNTLIPTILDDGSDVGLRLGNKDSPKGFTTSGLESYLGKVKVPKPMYDKCSVGLKLDILSEFHERHISNNPDDRLAFIRLYKDRIRFIGSGSYAKIDDLDIMKALSKIEMGLEVREFNQGSTHFVVRALAKDPIEVKGLRPYFPGVQIVNSEVGRASLKVQLILYEQVCTNGVVSASFTKQFMRVHRGMIKDQSLVEEMSAVINKVDEFAAWSMNRLTNVAGLSGQRLLTKINADKDISLGLREMVTTILPKYSSTPEDPTALDVVSAFTEAIQDRPGLERAKLEAYAGELIDL